MDKTRYNLGIDNYYGTVYAVENNDNTYHVELDDYSGTSKRVVSKELFDLLIKELDIG
ncbi:hypothetical protein LCM23_13210 [Cytobacillus kochii]|uniref:hypothetical protein n=1 Tax=Cytobacillus kochii TaxID=859143 RepID=UPI001CD5A2E9|nr:hypothetical protein [Cytobacillus kochii]MCA1027054.1 hypothetical protein [Cytobacillus kochii]